MSMYESTLSLLWERYDQSWMNTFRISPKELRMMSFSDRPIARLCKGCGQFHSPTDSHLYDYHQPIDDDLTCEICLQPLVDPVDTKCGHTFCARCIKNYLNLQNMCPNDRNPLAPNDLQPAPVIIRRLLDKLQVVCPNVDYCEEVLARCELEAHLVYRCKGAVVRCHRYKQGCKFQGPRSAMESHLWECEHADDKDSDLSAPIEEGQVTRISILRGSCDLGLSIVGGCDTPLLSVSIQEIFPNGLIDRDDRLRPGDQILEVNGVDLTQATHFQARKAFNQTLPVVKMTIYRDSSARNRPIEKEDIMKITLVKSPGRQLGIKLVGKRNVPGVYIKDLIPCSVASLDGQLRIDDRILEVNSDDLSILSQEHAANHIQAAHGKIQFVISRRTRPQTPDIISQCNQPQCNEKEKTTSLSDKLSASHPLLHDDVNNNSNTEKTIVVSKSRGESLGISVAGGLGSQRGDTPLYVMNTISGGPADRSGVKKGDILLSVNGAKIMGLNHNDAVRILKSKASHKKVELKLLDTSETAEDKDNFLPSWMYWLDLPRNCWLEHEAKLSRENGSLGFSISGGKSSNHGDQPIFIKSVRRGSSADKQNIRRGDVITSINGIPTHDLSHTEVVSLLNKSSTSQGAKITLNMVSWPGSIV
ncbi:ligand of Numb protein X 2-like [Watersipora subatra]|uniref:ligand of Numb protein X 2-like n=1 Tax=Watersipora subatra TaxID=2589382 RepID=UPI00355C9833